MIKVLFCIFSVFLGIYAFFFGIESVSGFEWRTDSIRLKYADPPFISKKDIKEISFVSDLTVRREAEIIECYSYDDFLKTVEKYRGKTQLEIEVKKSNPLREDIITKATASNEEVLIKYEPSLLIVLTGYGKDELIIELERDDDCRFLRLLDPNAQYSKNLAERFRKKGLSYALNSYGLDDKDLKPAMESVLYPRYSLSISKSVADYGRMDEKELKLKMKGTIYDSIIKSYEKGWELVVFDATIKNLKAIQSVLDDMSPLPVKLLSYPLWENGLRGHD